MTELWTIGLVIIGTFIGAVGSLYLKKGSSTISLKILELIQNYQLILGVILYLLSSVFFIAALKYGELSTLYPITSLSYIWISFLSIKFLKEKMNKYKWMGIFLIILGVIFLAR